MISPLIVERINGVWSARCISPACDKPHILALVLGRAEAERAADIHLKFLNTMKGNPT